MSEINGFTINLGRVQGDTYFFEKNDRYYENSIWLEPQTKRISKAVFEQARAKAVKQGRLL